MDRHNRRAKFHEDAAAMRMLILACVFVLSFAEVLSGFWPVYEEIEYE